MKFQWFLRRLRVRHRPANEYGLIRSGRDNSHGPSWLFCDYYLWSLRPRDVVVRHATLCSRIASSVSAETVSRSPSSAFPAWARNRGRVHRVNHVSCGGTAQHPRNVLNLMDPPFRNAESGIRGGRRTLTSSGFSSFRVRVFKFELRRSVPAFNSIAIIAIVPAFL